MRAAPPAAQIRDAIKSGGFQAVCFTSSSTVRNLVGIAGKPHAKTVVAVIGPHTAETAAEFGLRVDVQAETATVASLVQALADFAVQRAEEDREKAVEAANRKPRPHRHPPRPLTARLWSELTRFLGQLTHHGRAVGCPAG